jgi:hypothetical protein
MTQEQFEERAAYCRDMAEAAHTDEQRSAWSRVAALWLRMAQQHTEAELDFTALADPYSPGSAKPINGR